MIGTIEEKTPPVSSSPDQESLTCNRPAKKAGIKDCVGKAKFRRKMNLSVGPLKRVRPAHLDISSLASNLFILFMTAFSHFDFFMHGYLHLLQPCRQIPCFTLCWIIFPLPVDRVNARREVAFPFLALFDYVSRAHEIEIRRPSVRRPSVCGIDYL